MDTFNDFSNKLNQDKDEHENKPEFLNTASIQSDFIRATTSLRYHYLAQSKVIQRQIGTLNEIQKKLGLSQRKICQLLLVDPSAWTRWVKDESKVPPHIWRALQWYFILNEKIPGLTSEYFLGREHSQIMDQNLKIKEILNTLKKNKEDSQIELNKIKSEFRMYKIKSKWILFLLILIMSASFFTLRNA